MKKTFLFLFCYGFVCCSFGQNSESNFNLPPGSVFHSKTFKEIDYSYRLNELSVRDVGSNEEINFLAKFTKEELNDMKVNHPADFNYYFTANTFFESLSTKVKAAFSVEELWYIYIFDQELKNKITKY